jgi:hypothetical protein
LVGFHVYCVIGHFNRRSLKSETMKKQIQFVVSDTNQITQKVIDYFQQFDLKFIERKDGFLKFGHSSALLDAWKTNPLKWGLEVSVSISGNNIFADFYVDTDAQMNTKEEEEVWGTFIESFQNYLTNGVANNSKLNSMIANSRKSRLSYIGWTVLGAFFGGLLSFVYSNVTNTNSTFSIFLIPILATTILGWRISYAKTKKAL